MANYEPGKLRDLSRYFRYSLAQRGTVGSCFLWLAELYYCLRMKDFRLISKMEYPENENSAEHYSRGFNPYHGSYYKFLFESLKFLRSNFDPKSLIDIGAGHGRILRVASILGFQKVTGVERSADYVATAQRKLRGRKNIILINEDATRYVPDEKYDVMAIFNPFDAPIFLEMMQQIRSLGLLPTFVLTIGPSYDRALHKLGYEIVHSRATRRHIEYCIFHLAPPSR